MNDNGKKFSDDSECVVGSVWHIFVNVLKDAILRVFDCAFNRWRTFGDVVATAKKFHPINLKFRDIAAKTILKKLIFNISYKKYIYNLYDLTR